MPVKTCLIFAGGTGMNIATEVTDLENVYCIDTCDKNVVDAHRRVNVLLTKGTRGAGGNRKVILPLVKPQIPELMDSIPEADFYIVVYSLGGGSGSVLAPLITAKLIDRKAAFVSFVVGAMDSTDMLGNDIDTMKTLESIAVKKGLPLVVNYTPNTQGRSFDSINKEIAENIRKVVFLTNQNHGRLDVHDVNNWVRFTDKHVNLIPQVCELHIETSRKDAENVPEPISIVSLYTDPNKEVAFGTPVYRKTGIVKADDLDATDEQVHFVINSVGVLEIMKTISDAKLEMTRQQARFAQRNPIIDSDDEIDEDGMVV